MSHPTELDLGPLSWVKREIDLALARAAEALDDAREAADPGARRQFARTHLHQARGALSIVGLDGASQFAGALDLLLGALAHGVDPAEGERIELARRGLAALGNYLEELANGAADQPLRLAGLYERVAAAHGGDTASAADLFFPDLGLRPPARPEAAPALAEDERQRELRAARARFERGLLGWLRACAAEPLGLMREAVAAVEALQTSPAQRALWWASLAFLDTLADGGGDDAAGRQLCAQLNTQMRRLLGGAPGVPDRLMRELLYRVAIAPAHTEQQRAVRAAWRLDSLVPEPGAAVSEVPLGPLLDRLRTGLAGVKEAWNEFGEGTAAALPRFEQELATLAAGARGLGRPAVERLFAAISEFTQWLRKDPLRATDTMAIEVATALLLAEAVLDRGTPAAGFARQVADTAARLGALMRGEALPAAESSPAVEVARRAQEREAVGQLAREIRSNLAQVEQVLDDYFRDQGKHAPLATLAAPLKEIEGALTLLGETAALSNAREAAEAIAGFAAAEREVDPAAFAPLAHRLSALGFYVDSLVHGHASLEQVVDPELRPAQPDGSAQAVPAEPPAPAAETAAPQAPATEAAEGFEREPRREPAPVPQPTPETLKLMEASAEEIDAELLAIFIEEAHDVLAAVREELELSRTEPTDAAHLTAIRRGFHTLKGSGRMVGLRALGEAAWGIEQTLNRWLQLEWPPTPALHHLIDAAHQLFAQWVAQLEAGGPHGFDAAALLAEAERLREGTEAVADPVPLPEAAPAADAAAPAELHLEETSLDLAELTLSELGEVLPFGTREVEPPFLPEETSLDPLALPADFGELAPSLPAFLDGEAAALEEPLIDDEEIALDEAGAAGPGLLEELADILAQTGEGEIAADLAEAEGPVDLEADEPPAAEPPLPGFDFGDLPELEPAPADEPEAAPTDRPEADAGAAEAAPALDELAAPPLDNAHADDAGEDAAAHGALAEPAAAQAAAAEALAVPAGGDLSPSEPDLVRIGETEISRPLYDLYLAEARHHIGVVHADLARLSANPTLVPPEAGVRAAHTLAGISGTARLMSVHALARALEQAEERLRELAQPPAAEQCGLFKTTADTLEAMVAEIGERRMPLAVPELVEQLEAVGRSSRVDTAEPPAIAEEAAAPAATTGAMEAGLGAATVHDDLDAQLLPIFFEEGGELLAQLHAALRAWRGEPAGAEHAKATARLLHTLKGSARMAGAMTLGEHVHHLESRLEAAPAGDHEVAALIDDLESGIDHAAQMIDALAAGGAVEAAPAIVPAALGALAEAAEAEAAAGVPTLRVRADTIDRFVNEAGEIGIARTRIDGELRTLRRSLLDLTENVIRLRNQLREVEIQAEVQMQSRIAQAESHHAEFDPLEMDRYTRLQELTRMMAESVNDVTTVQQNLLKNLDGADVALHAQARMSRDLQQALMQVRMVPFDSLADRLHRVVRQSAKDLGKRANLDLRGGRIEIDRSLLERVVAPLEHLLRNAVAHGIEAAEARRAADKPELGQITVDVRQEGNEIAIELTDDGAGLDFGRIAERARAAGLLGAADAADERRLTNLIFVPGFSTAGAVSAVSGRGVGMDVVKSEIAAVGGRIDVASTAGQGTAFRLYLPLTLAVTQALLVRAANRTHAIPSSMIAQVLELKADALAALRAAGGTEWQGERFAYRYLPRLLGDYASQPEVQRFNWVLLLRAGAQTLALHVDALRGNQEIVVKNAGPQLARIVGISGATVLGDGEIVLIVNPVALASRGLGAEAEPAAPADPASAAAPLRVPTVMVVDDSLTVRKITGRLLEREGYRVVTAKDGVDALEKLVEAAPDVILSDIEMPRMDGFDFLRNLRADQRTRDIPVIMITSRLAEKHRRYAQEVGASHYLGKPYQEEELLGLLKSYCGA